MASIILTETQLNKMANNFAEVHTREENGWIITETILPIDSRLLSEECTINPNLSRMVRGDKFAVELGNGKKCEPGATLWRQVLNTCPHVAAASELYYAIKKYGDKSKLRNDYFDHYSAASNKKYATYLDSYYFDTNLVFNKGNGKDSDVYKGTIRVSNHDCHPVTHGENGTNPTVEIGDHKYSFCVSIVFRGSGPGFKEKSTYTNNRVHIFEYKPSSLSSVNFQTLIKDTLMVGFGKDIDPNKFKEIAYPDSSIGIVDRLKQVDKSEKKPEPSQVKAEVDKWIVDLPMKMPVGVPEEYITIVRDLGGNMVSIDGEEKPSRQLNMTGKDKEMIKHVVYLPMNGTKIDLHKKSYYVFVNTSGVITGIGVLRSDDAPFRLIEGAGNTKFKVGKKIK